MLWLMLIGAYEVVLPEGGEEVVDLVIENQTDTLLKEPWIFVFSKPDWLSVSPDSVITHNLAKGEKVELRLKLKSKPSWFPGLREGELRLRVLVRNGEVAPDFAEFKVKEEPYEFASLLPWLLAREYTFTHTLTEHYDYYPIIFLHGMNATGESWFQPAWEQGYDDYTALEKLLDSNYRGYILGSIWGTDKVLDRDESPYSTIGNTYPKRVIYVVEYYKENYKPGESDPQGVIGSNRTWWPTDEHTCNRYQENMGQGEYVKEVAKQIDNILEVTYSDKVHAVAHSMGGIVLRAAIKWYGCEPKLNRVLMLGTPNDGCHYSAEEEQLISGTCYWPGPTFPEWMFCGEAGEIGIHQWVSIWIPPLCFGQRKNNTCFNVTCSKGDCLSWMNKLNEGNWSSDVKYATIAGVLNPKRFQIGPDDGVVYTDWVSWPFAMFNATCLSAHSSNPQNTIWWLGGEEEAMETNGEISLIANEYVTEYIKTWVIDGDMTKDLEKITITNISYSIDGHRLLIDFYLADPCQKVIDELVAIQIIILMRNHIETFEEAVGASYRDAECIDNKLHYEFQLNKTYSYPPTLWIALYALKGIAYGIEVEP
ncbi:MAG: hypothetical protein ABIN54_07345 [candidate division WOR-3 bacterium]